MRVLIALTYYRPHYSGLTIYAERLAKALAQRGHDVTILTSRFDRQLKANETREGVRIVRPWVAFHLSKGVIMPSILWRGWQLIRQAEVVNLHVPQLDAAPLAVMARLQGKPVVMTYHCDLRLPRGFIHKLANLASDIANHIAARCAQVIVLNSQDYAEHSRFLRPYLKKVHPVYPPVHLPSTTPQAIDAFRAKYAITPGQRIIGIAARLATEKGVEYLAQALPRILERFPTARVLHVGPYKNVIGEEAYGQRVMGLIEPVQDKWTWLGTVPDEELAAFFHCCDVLTLPSLNSTESFGMVQVEAMSCGAPVVASDLPGVRVPVQDSGMGKIAPPGNGPALAEAIMDVLERREEFARGGEAIVARTTPEAVAREYEQIFSSITHPAGQDGK
jgi:glycosyltransferase involved in cell wall biosynthesis